MNNQETLRRIKDMCEEVIDAPDQDINATDLPYTSLYDMIHDIFCQIAN